MKRRLVLGAVVLAAALATCGCSSYTTGPAGTTVKSVPWPWATARVSAVSNAAEGANEVGRQPGAPSLAHRPIESHLYR